MHKDIKAHSHRYLLQWEHLFSFFFSTQLEKKGDKGHEITLNNAVILETEQKNSDYKCSYVRIFRRCALTLLLSLVTLNSCITGVHCPLARSFSHFLPGVLSELYTHFICLYYTGDIWDMFFPFIPVQSHWNRRDQPEHQWQSQSDLPIPDACGNTIIIKSLSSLLTLTMIQL